MDPMQSNVGEDSQGQFSGANMPAYPPLPPWMQQGYQLPPGWVQQGYQVPPGWVQQGYQLPPGFVPTPMPTNGPEDPPQAEMGEALLPVDADLVELPTPSTNKKNKNSGSRTKLGNFSPDEDQYLVKSWLEVSCDPITSTGQKRDRMWERITQRYQSSPTRCRPESSRPVGRDSAKAAKKKANSDASSTSSAEYAAKMQDLSLRRMSMQQEENVRKKERFEQLAIIEEQRFASLQKHNEAVLQLEQDKFQLMREKQDDARTREEERILAIDLDKCTPQLRVYYQALQEDIMQRLAERRQRK